MDLAENLQNLRSSIPGNVGIVAVSKRKSVEDIRLAYEAGQRDFGENRVQELLSKQPLLPGDIRWHMVGHLQSNKVKYLVDFIGLIHSIDSLNLLQTVDREGQKAGRVIPCLLQVHIALEESKFGFGADELRQLASAGALQPLRNVLIRGVMGMATFTDDARQVRSEFHYLKEIFQELKHDYFADSGDFSEISMGMSGDYRLAIEEGSTMIRVGTLIFGPRNE
jgi:pyridoxal phosphate enzyme (YggS family)